MALPNDDPSLPTANNPYFQDNSFVRGDQLRNNNTLIWGNDEYLDNTIIALTAEVAAIKASANSIFGKMSITYPWLLFSSGNASTLVPSGIAFGNDTFVMITQDTSSTTDHINRSTDGGITWSLANTSAANAWIDITFGNNTFVAISLDGTNRAMYSTNNGATWTTGTAGFSVQWFAVGYGNSVFVAVGNNMTQSAMRSTNNGVTWSLVTTPNNPYVGIAFGNNTFVAVSSASITNAIMYSTNDGVTWTGVNTAVASSLKDVTFGDGVFIAVGILLSGTNSIVLRSTDGINWSSVVLSGGGIGNITKVIFGNGVFIILSANQGPFISYDLGLTWSAVSSVINFSSSATPIYGVYGNNKFVSPGSTYATVVRSHLDNDFIIP